MKQNDLTLDMFRVLKREAYTNFLRIINGTYIFKENYSYLNKVPIEIRNLTIEKIMYLCTGRRYQEGDNPVAYLMEFLDKFEKMSRKQLKGNLLIDLKYAVAMREFKKPKNQKKKKLQRIIVALLFSTILMVNVKNNSTNNDITDDFSIEETFGETMETEITPTIALATKPLTTEETIPESTKPLATEETKPEPTNETTPPVETEAVLTFDEKIQNILEEQNLTQEQLDVICAIVTAEAKTNSYEDAYCVINTMYNRQHSKTWVNYVSKVYGYEDAGNNLYNQATMSGQFVVYQNGRYLEFLGNHDTVGYQAVVDMLTSKECIHDYLSFRSAGTELDEYNQIVEDGNKYFNVLEENDRLESPEMER